VSTTSDQQPPAAPRNAGHPSTREIPVAAPAAQPAAARPATGGAHLPPPGAVAPQPQSPPPVPPQPTGPVDGVPGLSEAPPTTPVSTPGRPDSLAADAARPSARRRIVGTRPADRRAAIGLGLAALAVALLETGLLLRFGSESLWSAVTLWSAFASLSGLLALLAFAAFYPPGNRLRSGAIWKIAAAGLVGLSVFWVLVVLPVVASDRGFVLTAALGCLGAALWIGPRRKD
jgi:hypothetical protein